MGDINGKQDGDRITITETDPESGRVEREISFSAEAEKAVADGVDSMRRQLEEQLAGKRAFPGKGPNTLPFSSLRADGSRVSTSVEKDDAVQSMNAASARKLLENGRSAGSKGPVRVSSDAFDEGWDRIWGDAERPPDDKLN